MSDSESASIEAGLKLPSAARLPEMASKATDSSTDDLVEIGNIDDGVLELGDKSSSENSENAHAFDTYNAATEEVEIVAVVSNGAGTPVGGKRQLGHLNEEGAIEGDQETPTSVARPRLNINKAAKIETSHSARNNGKERCKLCMWFIYISSTKYCLRVYGYRLLSFCCLYIFNLFHYFNIPTLLRTRLGRPHKMTEDYTNFVGELMYPKTTFGPYGTAPDKSRFPVSRVNTLGYLISPLRRPTVLEKWSPYELSVFEASLTLFGKDFWQASKIIKTKSTRDVIELYYSWKKTDHYKQWKKSYIPDARDFAEA